MRTDVKIGIVLGLLVLGGVVVYFSLLKPPQATPTTPPDTGKLSNKPEPPAKGDKDKGDPTDKKLAKADKKADRKALPPLRGEEDVLPPPFSGPTISGDPVRPLTATPPLAANPPTTERKDAPPVVADRKETSPPGSIEEYVPPAFGPRRETTPPARETTPPVRDVTPPIRDITPPVRDVTPPVTPPASGEVKEYVVQQGDAGYWGIAEKVYGPGKGSQWVNIAKANPDLVAAALRPGMKLKVPPLPAPTTPVAPRPGTSDTGTPPVTPGGATTAGDGSPAPTGPAGSTIYIVKEHDAGLWVIAEKLYGNGSLYPLIQKANPNINSKALRPGQKLIVPPRPAGTSGPAPTTAGGMAAAPPSAAGGETVVVPGLATHPAGTPRRPASPASPPRRPVPDDRPIFVD